MTPKERAQAFIRKTEKRFKKPAARIQAVRGEAVFWSNFWTSCGLHTEPSYQEAIKVYKDYLGD